MLFMKLDATQQLNALFLIKMYNQLVYAMRNSSTENWKNWTEWNQKNLFILLNN